MRFLSPLFFSCLVAAHAQAALVGHYTFDDSGDRFADSSGNANDLTGVGTTPFSNTGISGDALALSNGGKGTVNLGNQITASSFTVSMWVNTPASAANFDDYIEIGSVGGNDGFVLERDASNSVDLYTIGGFPSGGSSLDASTILGDSSWHHLALVGDSTGGTITLYIDGAEETSAAWTASADFNNVTIGGRFLTGVRNIESQIDEVQLYDEVLSAGDISFLFNNPAASIPEPSSVALLGVASGILLFRRKKS